MPLSGKWLERARVPDPNKAVMAQADAIHFQPGQVEPVSPPAWAAPQYEAVAPGPEVVGLEWVTTATGLEPAPVNQGHQHTPGHTAEDPIVEVRNYSDVRFQHSDEVYATHVTTAETPSEVSNEARRRGLNADPINNPPQDSYGGQGWRHGEYRWWNVDRDFSPPRRMHDQRIVTPWVVTPIDDVPPPVNAGPYNSPFSSMARAIRNSPRPMLRRQPVPVDEAVLDDGTEDAQVYLPTWVTI